MRKDEFRGHKVETIYFGGGTPSLLTINELQRIFHTVDENYTVVDNPEITLEANPDDLMTVRPDNYREKSRTIYEDYLALGINRLSIGIQSFFADDLKAMNRAHNAQEAKQCLELATQYFDNITIDLIYGIPNMNLDKWEKNLQIAFEYRVPHISSYALTVEPKTALESFIKKGTYPPIDDDLAFQHFNKLIETTAEAGFIQYEISNFGKPDYFSKHNTSYWQGKPYLGIGPSAHSFNEKQRSWNVSNNSKYIKSIQEGYIPIEIETLSNQDRFNEYIMTGLRTIWGVSIEKVEAEFGSIYKKHLLQVAKQYINQDLLYLEAEHLYITKKGRFLSDGIASELFILN